MKNNINNVCSCCLKLLMHNAANVGFINEVMREMLNLLLIKLDLDVSEHPLVCGTCSEVLDEIFTFKSKCLYTEDIITADIETNSNVCLRDILIEIEDKRNVHIGDDAVICRLCIKIPLNGRYIALGETGDGISFIRDMIQVHLPEMNLSICEKPIICEACHVQVQNYVSFATNCMFVEEKIKLYCDLQKVSGPVDLESVLPFLENKGLDLQNRLDKDFVIKQEDDSLMVKVEKVQHAEDFVLEDHLIKSSSVSELYLGNEEIEIKSENDEMSEEMEDSVSTVARNNSGKGGSLKRKRLFGKSPSKGRKDKLEVVMLKCENCEYVTTRKDDSIRHMLTHHNPKAERKFKCDKCLYETDVKSYLRKHNLKHKDKSEVKMYKCENCEYQTIRKYSLITHMLTHRDPKAERKFKCDECPYETNNKAHLSKHNLRRHKKKLEMEMRKCENLEYESRQNVKDRDLRAERKFKCDKCRYETDFKWHRRMHNLKHKDKSEVETYKCKNCEFETKWKASLIQHMQRCHHNPKTERKFKCDKCPYETVIKSYIYEHHLNHTDKSDVQMYKCEICEYEVKWKHSLDLHMLRHRDPIAMRKFKCDKCPYETDIQCYLRKHNLKHKDKSEVKMHKCENCEYETKRKDTLARHILRHHDPSVERKFKCDKCPYETNIKSYLSKHDLKHKDKSEVMHK